MSWAAAWSRQCECRFQRKESRWAGSERRLHQCLCQIPFHILAIGIAAIGLSAGCDRPATALPAAEAQPVVTPAIHTVKPERATVRHRVDQPGFNIQSFQQAPLFAKVAGYIEKWNVDIGDGVKKNDALAVLYVPEMKIDVDRKQAALRQAAAQIEQAKASVMTAQAQVDRMKSQYERLSRFGKSGVLDQENVDEIRLNYEAARATLEKGNADVKFATAQNEAAKADLAYAKTMLDYATIRAPFDGVVTHRNINAGDFVQPAAGGTRGQPLFVVEQVDPVRVFVKVPGADAPWIKDGDPVTLELEGAGGTLIEAKVTRNARSLDPQNRTLSTEIDLPNPRGNLLPGMYVQARIIVQRKDAWTLPESVLVSEADQTICFRVEEGRAVRTPLQIGLRGNGRVEILMKQTPTSLSGGELQWTPITGQEEIVASGASSLVNGMKIQANDAGRGTTENR
jgi:RND family efflux transporter MFP subunit